MIQVDLTSVHSFMPMPYEAVMAPRLRIVHNHLQKGDGAGGEFTGWVHLPRDYDKQEFARIKQAAARIRQDSQALVVIGIGGSYLGARGVIECLRSPNYNLKKKDTPNIYFIGNGLSSDALTEVMDLVRDVDFSVNVISKSGTTTEPAVAFRFFRELLEKKYGKEGAARRIYATTDARKGALKSLATEKGYETFVVPDDIGGRYSVLTAVGLLPIAVAGIDIDRLMAGAADMMEQCAAEDMEKNPAWQYAAARYELYHAGKKIEILAAYEPAFRFMAEWWKQLYGESEGKENINYEPETSIALGFGFRCGFLGLLHLDVIQERLEREYNLDLVTTAPGVIYKVYKTDGTMIELTNPSNLPDPSEIDHMEEPIVKAEIIVTKEFIGSIMELCQERRGVYKSIDYIESNRAVLKYDLPLNEIIYDFFDALKSRSKGYASFDYELKDYEVSKLVKLDILINKETVDALSFIVHADSAYERGRRMCERLKDEIPRHLFEIPIQAAIGGKVIARETVKALRKDVLAKCYGGDISRKKKLLEKQKEGKKRMRQVGNVEIPQSAFMSVLKLDEEKN